MDSRGKLWRRLAAAAIVAAGVGVVWVLALGWIISLGASMFRQPFVREQIAVAYDGTPVISVQSDDLQMGTLDRRTLDGKPWPADYEWWLGGAYPRRFELPPGVVQFPVRWTDYGARIGGVTDGRKPPTAWYIVSSDARAERCYFAGYDPLSKLAVGYIGASGFRRAPPPPEEQFSMTGNEPGPAANRVTSTQYVERYSLVRYHDLSPSTRPGGWLMYFVDGKRLWEVDLRERTVRTLLEVPDSLSTSTLTALESTVAGTKTDTDARRGPSMPFRYAAAQSVSGTLLPAAGNTLQANAEPPKTANVLVIRTRDSLLLYDTGSGNTWPFKLPSEVPPDRVFYAYWTAPDTLLLNCSAGWWSGGEVRELYWISPDGTIQRQERVELQGYTPPSERNRFWGLCVLMPEPLAWAGALLGVSPFWRLQNYGAPTYAEALRQTFEVGWPMATIVLAVSIAVAWYTYRRHRRYFRPQPGAWAAFVFLFGVPGFIAYWLEHRRAKMEACGECGQVVPRDRDACASCKALFSPPEPVGTEIFA